jgi:phosphoribosylamine--glycine ligase
VIKLVVYGPNPASHALAEHVSSHERVSAVYFVEANQTLITSSKICCLPKMDVDQLIEFVNNNSIDLVILSNLEKQLEWAQKLKQNKIKIFFADQNSSQLEYDKFYTKKLFTQAKIPTPEYFICETKQQALSVIDKIGFPCVVKGSLADVHSWSMGNNTRVIKNLSSFDRLTDDLWAKGYFLILEKFVSGPELSYLVIANGVDWIPVGHAKDFKKQFDGDIGPNTVGMGSYCPVEYFDPVQVEKIVNQTLAEIQSRGITYQGFLSFGFIIDQNHQYQLLELNTRLPDPEFESIIQTIDSNLLDAILSCVDNQPLSGLTINDSHAVSISIMHKNYGVDYNEEQPINLLTSQTVKVYSADQSWCRNKWAAVITAKSSSRAQAADLAYSYVDQYVDKCYYTRQDIANTSRPHNTELIKQYLKTTILDRNLKNEL